MDDASGLAGVAVANGKREKEARREDQADKHGADPK